MRKLVMVAAVLAAVAYPAASHAQFTLGLRLGYAVAGGDAAKDEPLDDVVVGQVPFQVDAMWRFTPEIAAGLYMGFGVGLLSSEASDQCDAVNADCSATSFRFGVQGTYTLTTVSPTFQPWAGVGIGYESLTQEYALSGLGSISQDVTGWEYLNVQLGGDWKLSPLFSIGPYVMYQLGEFTQIEGEDIDQTAMHQWINFGVRGKFDFGAK